MSELQLRIKLEELLDEHSACLLDPDNPAGGSEEGCQLWLYLEALLEDDK